MDNPSEKVQLAAVRKHPRAVNELIRKNCVCEKAILLAKELRAEAREKKKKKKGHKSSRKQINYRRWVAFLDNIAPELTEMDDQYIAEALFPIMMEESGEEELTDFLDLTREELETKSHQYPILGMLLHKIPDRKWKKYKIMATLVLFERGEKQ